MTMLRRDLEPAAINAGAFAAGFLAMWLAYKLVGRVQGRVASREAPTVQSDAKLRERVRDRMGELVSHPRAIEVEVNRGIVRVSGQVLPQELDGLLQQLLRVPGVLKVHNALAVAKGPRAFGEGAASD